LSPIDLSGETEFFGKVAFSGFLLGNREKIAVVANDESPLWPAKMLGCLTHKHRLSPPKPDYHPVG